MGAFSIYMLSVIDCYLFVIFIILFYFCGSGPLTFFLASIDLNTTQSYNLP